METHTRIPIILAAITFYQMQAVQPNVKWSCYQETGSCYYSPNLELSHPDAYCHCRSTGGHLLKIDSLQERDVVITLIDELERPTGFYIGATDFKEEGTFVWEDGTPDGGLIPWHNWGSIFEPDNHNGVEHCVVLSNRLWWSSSVEHFATYDALDIKCDSSVFFVCEKSGNWTEHAWNPVSRDQIFSSRLANFSGVSQLECADMCTRNCRCRSLSHRQDGGQCVLYDKYTSRMSPYMQSPGYVSYE